MFQLLDHFKIDEIEVYVNNTLSTFNIANVLRRLSGVHWQQTLTFTGNKCYILDISNIVFFRKHPIGVACPQSVYD